MTNLNSPSGDLPNDMPIYQFSLSTFSVPALSTGGTYLLTGSTKSISISSAKNLVPVDNTNDRFAAVCGAAIVSAKISTVTSDACKLEVQYSLDGGTTYSLLYRCDLPANKNGNVSTYIEGGFPTIEPTAAVTGNAIVFRTVVTDATDPTTDLLTITSVRVCCPLIIMK